MKRIRLIATDIDGTILPFGQREIPDRILAALAEAVRQNIEVVPVSGRLLTGLPPELMEIPGIRYTITSNGAAVTNLLTGETEYERMIPAKEAAGILRFFETLDVYSCVYIRGIPYNRSRLHPGLSIHYSHRLDFFRRNPKENLADFVEEFGQPVEKVFVTFFEDSVRERILQKIPSFSGVRATASSAWNLEINHEEADKGSALAWLCGKLGIEAGEVAAMGDNENDLTMLSFAGRAIVPISAEASARAIATDLVPECALCGAAVYLEQLLGINK